MERNIISNYSKVEGPGCRVFYDVHAASGAMLELCAQTAAREEVRVLDFGNRCDMYYAARCLRYLTRDPVSAMNNIHLQRAFTCYQALTLADSLRNETRPVFVLDLCAPFLDENIPLRESERVFQRIVGQLAAAALRIPVFVGIKPIPQSLPVGHFLAEGLRPLSFQPPEKEQIWAEPFNL